MQNFEVYAIKNENYTLNKLTLLDNIKRKYRINYIILVKFKAKERSINLTAFTTLTIQGLAEKVRRHVLLITKICICLEQ